MFGRHWCNVEECWRLMWLYQWEISGDDKCLPGGKFLVGIGPRSLKGYLQGWLWSNVHIHGMEHIFDAYCWSIPDIFSKWISKPCIYVKVFVGFLLWFLFHLIFFLHMVLNILKRDTSPGIYEFREVCDGLDYWVYSSNAWGSVASFG